MTDHVDDWIKEHLGEHREVPADLVQSAKDLVAAVPSAPCPHCGKPITPFKRKPQGLWVWGWLFAAALSFGLSFAFPRRFMQFLALALFCGIKWAVDWRALKTKMIIFKALSEEPSRLHEHESRL